MRSLRRIACGRTSHDAADSAWRGTPSAGILAGSVALLLCTLLLWDSRLVSAGRFRLARTTIRHPQSARLSARRLPSGPSRNMAASQRASVLSGMRQPFWDFRISRAAVRLFDPIGQPGSAFVHHTAPFGIAGGGLFCAYSVDR